jgi:hypothetical protein
MGSGSRRPAAAPGARSSAIARQDHQRGPVVRANFSSASSRRRMTTLR